MLIVRSLLEVHVVLYPRRCQTPESHWESDIPEYCFVVLSPRGLKGDIFFDGPEERVFLLLVVCRLPRGRLQTTVLLGAIIIVIPLSLS